MTDRNDDPSMPRFSFGEMALSEDPGRPNLAAAGLSGVNSSGPTSSGARTSVRSAPVLSDAVARLRVAMVNEQNAPELLEYKSDVVNTVRGLVESQTERLDEEEDESSAALHVHLRRMELDRVNFMLRCYLRSRIKKIEKNVLFIFKDEHAYDKLSPDEQTFARGYSDLVEDHFNKSFLSMLPERLRILDKDGEVKHDAGPNLDKFVFCDVVNPVGPYAVSDDIADQPFDLDKDDIICVRYGGVRTLVESGDVQMI